MSDTLYIVTYTGPFGFIKPWTAVRDSQTYSQQFLTPSIVEGMRQKLGVSEILRHRLSHGGFSHQQETTQSGGWKKKVIKSKQEAIYERPTSILERRVMLSPRLYLAFPSEEEAARARQQHLCLCRNEDVILPEGPVRTMSAEDFDAIEGFELRFGQGEGAFMVGYNRFEDGAPMYGSLTITGDPVSADPIER